MRPLLRYPPLRAARRPAPEPSSDLLAASRAADPDGYAAAEALGGAPVAVVTRSGRQTIAWKAGATTSGAPGLVIVHGHGPDAWAHAGIRAWAHALPTWSLTSLQWWLPDGRGGASYLTDADVAGVVTSTPRRLLVSDGFSLGGTIQPRLALHTGTSCRVFIMSSAALDDIPANEDLVGRTDAPLTGCHFILTSGLHDETVNAAGEPLCNRARMTETATRLQELGARVDLVCEEDFTATPATGPDAHGWLMRNAAAQSHVLALAAR